MIGYTQLTQGQRYQMEALYKTGHNQTMIATILSIYKSTVNRELQLNQGLWGYRPKQAHVKTMHRRHDKPRTHIPLTTLGYGECSNRARLESRTNFRSFV